MMEILTIMDMVSRGSMSNDNDLSTEEAAENFMQFMAALSLWDEQVQNIPVSDSIETIIDDENPVLETISEKEEGAYPLTAWLTLQDFIFPDEPEQALLALSGQESELTELDLNPPPELDNMQILSTLDAQTEVLLAETSQDIPLKKENMAESEIIAKASIPTGLPYPEKVSFELTKHNYLSMDHQDNTPVPDLKTAMDSFSSFKDFIHVPATDENTFISSGELAENPGEIKTISQVYTSEPNSLVKLPVTAKTIEVSQPVAQKDWSEGFNQQILWLGQQKIKMAVLRLNPQDLGPVEVNIKMVKEGTSIHMTTHSTQVHDIIEQSLPRLRELFQHQGLQLDQVNVEQKETRSGEQRTTWSKETHEKDNHSKDSDGDLVEARAYVSQGLIDYFA